MEEKLKTLLFLDDTRDPFDTKINWLVFSPIEQPFEVVWVKKYHEFVDWITRNGLPDAICFDHDIQSYDEEGSEKTGYDTAKWLVGYCIDNNKQIPLYNIQSANPVGKKNIDDLLKNYIKYLNNEK